MINEIDSKIKLEKISIKKVRRRRRKAQVIGRKIFLIFWGRPFCEKSAFLCANKRNKEKNLCDSNELPQ